MDQYFLYEDQLTGDQGFPLFGKIHLLWLLGIMAAGFLLVFCYQRMDSSKRKRMERIFVTVMVLMDLYKNLILVISGNYYHWELPLDLCAMAVYLSLLHGFCHFKATEELLFFLCLPGAMAALLFPNWNGYPQFNFVNIHSFLIHGLLVIYPCMLLAIGELKPDLSRYYYVWMFLGTVVPFLIEINRLFGTDFFFLSLPSKDSPLVPLFQITGSRFYLAGFAVLVMLVHLCLYGIYRTVTAWRRSGT